MKQPHVVLKEQPPTASEFAELRQAIGWTNPAISCIQDSIDNSLFWVSIYQDKQLIGCGRVVGDGAMYFYLQDVIVHPDHQECGLGKMIMDAINRFISVTCRPGSTVGLLAAKGKEGFYLNYGFTPRDGQNLGLGMCRFI